MTVLLGLEDAPHDRGDRQAIADCAVIDALQRPGEARGVRIARLEVGKSLVQLSEPRIADGRRNR